MQYGTALVRLQASHEIHSTHMVEKQTLLLFPKTVHLSVCSLSRPVDVNFPCTVSVIDVDFSAIVDHHGDRYLLRGWFSFKVWLLSKVAERIKAEFSRNFSSFMYGFAPLACTQLDIDSSFLSLASMTLNQPINHRFKNFRVPALTSNSRCQTNPEASPEFSMLRSPSLHHSTLQANLFF